MCNDFGNRVPYDDYLRTFIDRAFQNLITGLSEIVIAPRRGHHRQGEDDAGLFAAEREFAESTRRFRDREWTDEEIDALADEHRDIEKRIYTTAPPPQPERC